MTQQIKQPHNEIIYSLLSGINKNNILLLGIVPGHLEFKAMDNSICPALLDLHGGIPARSIDPVTAAFTRQYLSMKIVMDIPGCDPGRNAAGPLSSLKILHR